LLSVAELRGARLVHWVRSRSIEDVCI
jgi:hypothetical protein